MASTTNDRDVRIVLTVDGKQYEAELAKASKTMRDFGKDGKTSAAELAHLQGVMKGFAGVAAAGAAVVGTGAAIARLAVESFNAAQAQSELATRLGVSFNQLQGLQLLAESSGNSVESLAKASVRLGGIVQEAIAGKSTTATQALAKLGITTEQLAAVQNDSTGQLALVADGLSRMEAGSRRTALAADLLGERNTQLINTLVQGGDAFRNAEAEADRFGLTLGKDALGAINDADDAVDRLNATLGGLKTRLAVEVAPGIEALANATTLLLDSLSGRGNGIRINVPTVPGLNLGNPGVRYGLGGAIPGAPQSTQDALAALGKTGFSSGIVLEGGEESARRAEVAQRIAESLQSQLDSALKISAVDKVRRDLLKERVPLESKAAQEALRLAAAVDAARPRNAQAVRDEADLIRSQQERNRLLSAELETGVAINGAQAQLIVLNTRFEATNRTTLQAELEKGAQLERQLDLRKDALRLAERERDIIGRRAERFFERTAPQPLGAQAIRDEATNGSRADLDRVYDSARSSQQSAYENDLRELELYRAEAEALGVDANEREAQIHAEHLDRLAALDRAYQATKDQLRQQDLQRASDFFGDLATVASVFGEKGFKAYKAFAIAQTVISTYQSAVDSYTSLAKVPVVGPVLGAAAAAAAIATGLARVQAIRAQQPQGREKGGPVTAGQMYEVGERGRPELLETGGRFFLIPGNQGGMVRPATTAAGGPVMPKIEFINSGVTVQQTRPPQFDGKTLRFFVEAAVAEVDQRLLSPSSSTSRAARQGVSGRGRV